MTEISLDALFSLVDEAPFLDRVESELRNQGCDDLADALVKLQQDCALEIDWAINGKDDNPPGPETARLWKNYSEITSTRFTIFGEIIRVFQDGELEKGLQSLTQILPQPDGGYLIGSTPARDIR